MWLNFTRISAVSVDETKQLVYIGKSYNLGSRISTSIKERKAHYFSYSIVDNKVDTDIYEIYYIAKFKPILNGTSKNEDYPTIVLQELEFTEPMYIY
jgi:excinuclease UvrABC nuclease subunit